MTKCHNRNACEWMKCDIGIVIVIGLAAGYKPKSPKIEENEESVCWLLFGGKS